MSADERLTENVRVRLSPTLKARLEQHASSERRSPAFVARRAIERDLDRAEAGSSRKA